MKINASKLLEWGGVFTAILYSFLIAFNINAEFLSFALLLISFFLLLYGLLWANIRGYFFYNYFML